MEILIQIRDDCGKSSATVTTLGNDDTGPAQSEPAAASTPSSSRPSVSGAFDGGPAPSAATAAAPMGGVPQPEQSAYGDSGEGSGPDPFTRGGASGGGARSAGSAPGGGGDEE